MSWTEKKLDSIWKKATQSTAENETNGFRKDTCGAWIKRDQHGLQGKYGWEVDHIVPQDANGSDDLENLRPLHWENNGAKSNHAEGEWSCAVTSEGGGNVAA